MATASKKASAKAGSKPAAKKAAPAKASKPVAKKAAPVKASATKKAAPAKTAKPVAKKAAPAKASKPAAKKPTPAKTGKPVAKKAAPAKAGKPAVKKAPAAKPAPAKKVSSIKASAKPAAAKKPAPAKAAAKPVAKKAVPVKATPTVKKAIPAVTKTATAAPVKPSKAAAPATTPNASGLSEAQILKMADKDYMNDKQLGFFKAKLMDMRAEILDNARETGEHLKENEVFADPNDRATVEEENMLEQRVRDRERKLLKKIESALRRIEAGEYGYCLETGEPIGLARLIARPTAELSIEAQEKHERRERLFAD